MSMPPMLRDKPLNLLQSALAKDRLAHAVMLHGPPGTDKLQIAHEMARSVLCAQRKEGKPCGKCTSCKAMDRMVHQDVHWTVPVVGAKNTSRDFFEVWREQAQQNPWMSISDWLETMDAENKEPNINVRECHAIIRGLGLKPQQGDHKALILWLPEYLGKEGNRLLKLIEEPPENTFLFLVAEDTGKILNTILSRCEMVKVPPFSDEQIARWLEERSDLPPERAREKARLADGQLNEALGLDRENEDSVSEAFLEWMRLCYIAHPKKLVDWVNETAKKDRNWQKQLFRYGLHFARELLQMDSGRGDIRFSDAERTTASKFSRQLRSDALVMMTDIFNHGLGAIERNAHRKTLFLSSTLRLKDIFYRD